ncbi:ribose-phosphate diphosphokinase [Spirochaeta cellobiosiphila]|uniref:ribose-phosphate diphosphokinase n=1 Tax=Spirochaeta cellobiosiphila TaxID=504483 RepID=UPI0004157E95|nr:ribose-phosphate diphosphokinase [Spirochaeta cellobiosiphila]
MNDYKDMKIFAGSTGKDFATKIARYLNMDIADGVVHKFADGNIFVKANETVRGKDVYLVQSIGLNPNEQFTEILFWMDAFKRASAHTVTAIIPYYGYAKGDKKDEPRVSIRARVCADAIEMAGADRVVTMDLHSPQIQGFFRKTVDHIRARPILVEYIKRLKLKNPVIVSPDAGFAKDARKFALALGFPVAIGDKTRKGYDDDAIVLDIIGDVAGKEAVIVDDFSISGGTLIDLARGLIEKGATRVIACLSHILLNSDNLKRIEDSPIEVLVSTDSVYNPAVWKSNKIKILSVAPLFAETLRHIHSHESVSSLFDRPSEQMIKYALDK